MAESTEGVPDRCFELLGHLTGASRSLPLVSGPGEALLCLSVWASISVHSVQHCYS